MSSEKMKAILVKESGHANNLYLGEADKPKMTPKDLLVRVRAAGLNRADVMQREGRYPPPPGASNILGLEIAGEVEQVGDEAGSWSKGDRIMCILPGGGYAEYAVVPGSMAMKIPGDIPFEQAAGIPETFLTAYQTIFTIAGLNDDQKVLLHAGASGVGLSAIQLCKLKKNVSTYVTAGSQKKIDFCKSLGAAGGANYKEGSWYEQIKKQTDSVDIILDPVASKYIVDNMELLAMDGTIVIIAAMGGNETNDPINMGNFFKKRLCVRGSNLRGRTVEYKSKLSQNFLELTKDKFEDGTIKPIIDKVFDWKDVVKAHEYMESNETLGKIILTGM